MQELKEPIEYNSKTGVVNEKPVPNEVVHGSGQTWQKPDPNEVSIKQVQGNAPAPEPAPPVTMANIAEKKKRASKAPTSATGVTSGSSLSSLSEVLKSDRAEQDAWVQGGKKLSDAPDFLKPALSQKAEYDAWVQGGKKPSDTPDFLKNISSTGTSMGDIVRQRLRDTGTQAETPVSSKSPKPVKNNSFWNSEVQDMLRKGTLPPSSTIKNDLELHPMVETLPDNLTIKGSLKTGLGGRLKALPKGLIVEGSMDLGGSMIKTLPEKLNVPGDFKAPNNLISLPSNMTVGGSLNLNHCPITEYPKDVKVGKNVNLMDTKISTLPSNMKVPGDLDLFRTHVEKFPAGFVVKGKVRLPDGRVISSVNMRKEPATLIKDVVEPSSSVEDDESKKIGNDTFDQ